MRVSRYTPSLLAPEHLEALFVQRHTLAGQLVGVIQDSALTDSKHYTLLIGPRGIGKTHLVSMLYHRVAGQEDLTSHLVVAWLREEEWGISSFFDLVLRILNALQAEYKDDELADKIGSLYELAPEETEAVALSILKTFIGNRTLLLFVENLDEVFAGLGDIGQKQLRSFLQEQGCCTMVATSPSLFNGVKLQTSPFYGFFRIRHLKDFSVEEAVSLLTKIAQQEDNSKLVDFLRTPKGRSRVQAVHHLAGGNPRIYVVFSEFLTHESLDELIQPFMNMLDDLTPYYQARMMYLSPQQRKIIEVLSRRKYAMPVKEIAQRCFVSHQTVSNQLKDLRDKGYVLADSIGRQSFYELREPLMRICLSVKETRGEPVRLIVDFLKAWYPRSELQGMRQWLGKGKIREAEESSRFRGIGSQQSGRATSQQSSSIANDAYLALALVEQEEEDLDPRIAACVQECNQQYEQQNFDKALTVAKKLVKLRGREIDHHWQGLIEHSLGRFEDAIASYDKALEFKPDEYQAWYNRGIALGDIGRYEDAITSYDKALQFKPDKDQAWCNRGNALFDLERFEDAIASYDKALQFKPDDDDAWYNRGNALGDLGQFEDAITSYDKALQFKPDDDAAWNNRGNALGNLGRYEEEIASYDKALQFKPDYEQAWNNRGSALGDLGHFEDAITSYDKALEFKPDDEMAWYNRGIALRNLGRYEDAIASYDKALEINPEKHFGLLNRAEIVFASNPNDAAYQTLENALSQLTEAEITGNWPADIMLRSLFQQNQDTQKWQLHIQKLIPLFEKYQFLNALGVGLIKSCNALISAMVSQDAAQAWLEIWTEAAEGHEEFKIPLRLLKAAVHYKAAPEDPRVFLQLPSEERTILKQALGLETG